MDENECCCYLAAGLVPCKCTYGLQVARELSFARDKRPKSIEVGDTAGISAKPIDTVDLKNPISCGFSEIPAVAPTEVDGVVLDARWRREITLTQPAENKDPYDLLNTMRRIVQSAMFDIVWWLACIELTDKGTPHIHMLVQSNAKYFNASKIKYFHKYRYECAPVRDIQKYIEYIYKEKNDRLHIEFCLQKGIDQFYGTNYETQTNEKTIPVTGWVNRPPADSQNYEQQL